MNKFSEFLTGIKVLEEVESPYNGKITVIKSFGFGTYLQVDGLTQSGGILTRIWNKVLKKIRYAKSDIQNILILGLGGGSVVGLIKKYWPEAKITAVDIDPVIVGLGEKYLGLNKNGVKVVISDAYKFLTSNVSHRTSKFDLILVDLYRGDEFPKEFHTEKFVKLVKSNLVGDGTAVFNRLYYGDKRSESVKFGNMLEKSFSKVKVVYPEANIMFVCSK
jgi:spermidine synthase